MQALILAAGGGTRLGVKGRARPKCLLQIGRRPLIEHHLEMFAEAGVAPVGMVVGYCSDEIREVVGIRAEYTENPRWNTTNSLYSFWLARDWVKGPLIVMNADTLVHPETLDRLLDADGDAFAYDSGSGNAREHMKVRIQDGLLVDMSKKLPQDETSGENVGILKFTAQSAQELMQTAGKLIERGGEKDWIGSAVRLLAARRAVRAVDVSDLPWGEIDSSYDLDRVRKIVLPAIRRSAWKRKVRWRATRWVLAAALVGVIGSMGFKLWVAPPPPEVNWDTLDLDDIQRVKLRDGERKVKWWMLTPDGNAEVVVNGPTTVRIDTRLVLPEREERELPYIVEVAMDGERVDWFKNASEASEKWSHPDWVVGQRDRTKLDIPRGSHTVGVKLLASDSGRMLVRIRQMETGEDE